MQFAMLPPATMPCLLFLALAVHATTGLPTTTSTSGSAPNTATPDTSCDRKNLLEGEGTMRCDTSLFPYSSNVTIATVYRASWRTIGVPAAAYVQCTHHMEHTDNQLSLVAMVNSKITLGTLASQVHTLKQIKVKEETVASINYSVDVSEQVGFICCAVSGPATFPPKAKVCVKLGDTAFLLPQAASTSAAGGTTSGTAATDIPTATQTTPPALGSASNPTSVSTGTATISRGNIAGDAGRNIGASPTSAPECTASEPAASTPSGKATVFIALFSVSALLNILLAVGLLRYLAGRPNRTSNVVQHLSPRQETVEGQMSSTSLYIDPCDELPERCQAQELQEPRVAQRVDRT